MRVRVFMILLFVLLSPIVNTSAQDIAPLFMILDGYLYAWTAADGLQQLTDSGTVDGLALSPDGTQLVYGYYPERDASIPMYTVTWEAPFFPNNIIVRDISTGHTTQINQPSIQGGEGEVVARSRPIWSSDGTLILWGETLLLSEQATTVEDYRFQTVAHNVATGENHLLPGIGHFVDVGLTRIEHIEWGGGGYFGFVYGVGPEIWLVSYDIDGNRLIGQEIGTYEYGNTFAVSDVIDLTDNGQRAVGIYFRELNVWNRLDVETFVTQPITDGVPALYSLDNPDSSINVYYHSSQSDPQGGEWVVLSSDGTEQARFSGWYYTGYPSISPDGQQFAYNTENGVVLWDGSQAQIIEGAGELSAMVWGVVRWRVIRGEGLDTGDVYLNAYPCDTYGSRLVADSRWRSTSGLIYYENIPFVGVRELAEGVIFTVLSQQPVCLLRSPFVDFRAGIYFWRVEVNGQEGWIEEYSEYFSYYLVQCPGSEPTRLTEDTQAQVIPDIQSINFYTEPSTDSDMLAQIPAGEPFQVYRPRCADGLTWWSVRYNGTIGWVVESQGDTFFLEPINVGTDE